MADSITRGAVFQLTGFENKELSREDFKTYFNDYAKVAWVDYDKGDSKAMIRLSEANTAQSTLDKVKADHDGKLEVLDCVVEAKVLEGDEELDHSF